MREATMAFRAALGSLILAVSLIGGAHAQTYPTKPVQVFVHFNPGAVVDILGRVFADELSTLLGQQFVVVNREGASGIIANQAVAQARPDGYTIAFTPQGSIVIQPQIKKDLGYSIDSFAPICQVFENQFVMLVSHDSPYRNLKDIVDYARANPGKMSFGVFGIASVPHLQMHSFLFAAKLQMTQVPYKSLATMSADTASRQIDIGVTAWGSFNPQQVRVAAALAPERNPLAPDIPTTAEAGYPVSAPAFGGLMAPKGTPAEVLKILGAACEKASHGAKWQEVLKRTGTPGPYLGAADYEKRLREDIRSKGELVRALNIKDE
jgi:tripartite-type tricarboxylate transporter receptor subunit TctC